MVGTGHQLLGEGVDAARRERGAVPSEPSPPALPSGRHEPRELLDARADTRSTSASSQPVKSNSGIAVAAVDVSSTASPRERVVGHGLRGPQPRGVGRLAAPSSARSCAAHRSRPGSRSLAASDGRPAALVAVEQAREAAGRPASSTAVSDGTIAATLTPRTRAAVTSASIAASAARGPVRHATSRVVLEATR